MANRHAFTRDELFQMFERQARYMGNDKNGDSMYHWQPLSWVPGVNATDTAELFKLGLALFNKETINGEELYVVDE